MCSSRTKLRNYTTRSSSPSAPLATFPASRFLLRVLKEDVCCQATICQLKKQFLSDPLLLRFVPSSISIFIVLYLFDTFVKIFQIISTVKKIVVMKFKSILNFERRLLLTRGWTKVLARIRFWRQSNNKSVNKSPLNQTNNRFSILIQRSMISKLFLSFS